MAVVPHLGAPIMKKLGRFNRLFTPPQGMTCCALIRTNCNWVGPAHRRDTARYTANHARRRAFGVDLADCVPTATHGVMVRWECDKTSKKPRKTKKNSRGMPDK